MSSSEDEYRGYSIKWDVIYKADTSLFAAQAAIVSHPDSSGIASIIQSRAVMILQRRMKLGTTSSERRRSGLMTLDLD
jgi:hypothetical protein